MATGSDIYAIIVQELVKNKARFLERLERNVAPQTVNGKRCHVWTGATNSQGYPRINFWREGKVISFHVHDLFWTLKNKRPKPKGFTIDHTCNNRRCVEDLELIPHKKNIERREERRNANGKYRHVQ